MSHAHNHMHVTSHACHITYMSHAHHMHVTCPSHACHMPISYACHMPPSHACHIPLSHACHISISHACHMHVTCPSQEVTCSFCPVASEQLSPQHSPHAPWHGDSSSTSCLHHATWGCGHTSELSRHVPCHLHLPHLHPVAIWGV